MRQGFRPKEPLIRIVAPGSPDVSVGSKAAVSPTILWSPVSRNQPTWQRLLRCSAQGLEETFGEVFLF
ncbi:hypothetical protein, partial [Bradyrhizobium sp. NAS80.1]|uniref:hypothetical protein n=1 Tax=Bradyrhizobium sp. NAS80.1 TaxID=1680159 RepID=UPI001AF01C9A